MRRVAVALVLTLASTAAAQDISPEQKALEKKLAARIDRSTRFIKLELRETAKRNLADLAAVAALPAVRRRQVARLLEVVERTPYWYLRGVAVDLKQLRLVPMPEMVAELAKARIVGVAEQHDKAAHHILQSQVASMLDSWGRTAVGVEMVTRDRQELLDRYTSRKIDEQQFLKELDWKKTWGFDWKIYAPIWRAARSRRQPIVALNIKRALVRAVGRQGLKGVSAEIRAQLPKQIDTTVASHRARFFRLVRHHPTQGDGQERMNRMYEAMCVWDEAMAESAVRFLEANPKYVRMVIVAGSGHLAYHDGIPARCERRGAGPAVVVVPREVGVDHVSQLRADILRPPGRYVVFVR